MIDQGLEEKIGRVAGMIAKAENIVVFTGAGVSTESGIPDFRSPGGIWTKFDPEDFTIDKYLTSPETRRKQWRFLLSGDLFKDARPNAAHEAIADLERLGRLNCVITQNIDNLHQKAGNDPAKVFELHGNMRWIRCLDCGERYPLEEILQRNRGSEEAPGLRALCRDPETRCDLLRRGPSRGDPAGGDPACEPLRSSDRRRLVARRLPGGQYAALRQAGGGRGS